jgi:hypothetical protein
MTVKVYIWKGINPELSVYNALDNDPNNVGHVSIRISDDSQSNDDIYISHRPPATSSNPPDTSSNPSIKDKLELFNYAIKEPVKRALSFLTIAPTFKTFSEKN